MSRSQSGSGMIVAGAIVIAAGFGVALVKTLGLPNYTILFVVVGAMLAVGLIRRFNRPRP